VTKHVPGSFGRHASSTIYWSDNSSSICVLGCRLWPPPRSMQSSFGCTLDKQRVTSRKNAVTLIRQFYRRKWARLFLLWRAGFKYERIESHNLDIITILQSWRVINVCWQKIVAFDIGFLIWDVAYIDPKHPLHYLLPPVEIPKVKWCCGVHISISASTQQSHSLLAKFRSIQCVLVFLMYNNFLVGVCYWVTDCQLLTVTLYCIVLFQPPTVAFNK